MEFNNKDILSEITEELNSLPPYKYIELYNHFNRVMERVDVTEIKDSPQIVLSAMGIFSGVIPIKVRGQNSTHIHYDISQAKEKRFIGLASMKVISSWERLETELTEKQARELEKALGLKPFHPKDMTLPTMFGN